MPSFEIQRFTGLDTRRYELTSTPGSLETLINGHVNQGGEVEKRKSFPKTPLPSQTFGAQETATGITTFGSRDVSAWLGNATVTQFNFGGGQIMTSISITITGNQLNPQVGDPIQVAGSSFPGVNGIWTIAIVQQGVGSANIGFITGAPNNLGLDNTTVTPYFAPPFTYLKLAHPTEIGNPITMTGVVSSTYFNGQPFAVTTWSNGDTLVFYGSTLLTDFYYGLKGSLESTPQSMALDLVAQVNTTTNFTATINALANLFFLITGGSAGTISVQYGFQVVNQITPFLATNLVTIASGVAWTTDNNTTATALANAITASTDAYAGGPGTSLGFTGTAAVNKVTIASPFGIQPGDYIIVTVTGNVTYFAPTPSATFTIFSVPDQSSSNPFTVSQVVTGLNQTFQLLSTGTPAIAGANAVGQFTVYGGSSNKAATGLITQSGQPANGQNVIVGLVTYLFVTTLSGAVNEVLIGSTAAATLANLANAINAATGAGVTYGFNTQANQQASAVLTSATVITLTASTGGTPGNTVVLSTTASNYVVTPFAGGGPNTNGINSITVGGTNILSGPVQFNSTASQTANDLITNINAFSGTSGFNATANGAVVSIISNATGTTNNGAVVIITSTGNVVTANSHFVVQIGAGQTISSVNIGAAGPNLLSATLTFQDAAHATETVAQFLGRVAANINANTATTGGLAWADLINVVLWVSSAVNSSADPTSTLSVTGTLAQVGGSTNPIMQVSQNFQVSPMPLTNVLNASFGSSPQSMIVSPIGGIPPYTYNWTIPSFTLSPNFTPGSGGVQYHFTSNGQKTINNGAASQSVYIHIDTGLGAGAGNWGGVISIQCVVTDSSIGSPQEVIVNFVYDFTFT